MNKNNFFQKKVKLDAVFFHYTVKSNGGKILATSFLDSPISLEGSFLPNKAQETLLTLNIGEETCLDLGVEDAFGPHQAYLVVEIPKYRLPEGHYLEKGEYALGGKVVHVTKKAYIIDQNHPLAGLDVIFEIERVGPRKRRAIESTR